MADTFVITPEQSIQINKLKNKDLYYRHVYLIDSDGNYTLATYPLSWFESTFEQIPAPELSEVHRWLRCTHDLLITITPKGYINVLGYDRIRYDYTIYNIAFGASANELYSDTGFDSYEDALKSAIDNAINLISEKI